MILNEASSEKLSYQDESIIPSTCRGEARCIHASRNRILLASKPPLEKVKLAVAGRVRRELLDSQLGGEVRQIGTPAYPHLS